MVTLLLPLESLLSLYFFDISLNDLQLFIHYMLDKFYLVEKLFLFALLHFIIKTIKIHSYFFHNHQLIPSYMNHRKYNHINEELEEVYIIMDQYHFLIYLYLFIQDFLYLLMYWKDFSSGHTKVSYSSKKLFLKNLL